WRAKGGRARDQLVAHTQPLRSLPRKHERELPARSAGDAIYHAWVWMPREERVERDGELVFRAANDGETLEVVGSARSRGPGDIVQRSRRRTVDECREACRAR